MSMNLFAASNKGEIYLWQTPTEITYMILPPSMGSEVKGKKAKEALIRYLEWVKGSVNKVWESKEAADFQRQVVDDHVTYIEYCLNHKGLRVWVM